MKLKIGTRGSDLALAQTTMAVNAAKMSRYGLEVELIPVSTLGDRRQGTPEAKVKDKKEWIIDLEKALLAGRIDVAFHSGKDVPADIEPGTKVVSVLKREDPLDVFVGRKGKEGERIRFADLPQGSEVGTASLRRKAQLLRLRPDLRVREFRGNVPTRLRKLDADPALAGIVLAGAGIKRLGLAGLNEEPFLPDLLLPAVNQGILCAQYRGDDESAAAAVGGLTDPETEQCFRAERACIEVLGADCSSSVGVFARAAGGSCTVAARVFSHDGKECIEAERSGDLLSAESLGKLTGEELLRLGASGLL